MSVIRKVVEQVDRWLEENGLQISTTKTKKLQKTPPLHQYQRKSAGRGGSTRFEHPKEFQGG
jgi:nucleoside diphosphate kinase